MLQEDEKRNGWPIYCVIDTSALFGYPDQVEMLSKALIKNEFDGKKGMYGKIVIPEVVRREVNDYYYHCDSKLSLEDREAKKKHPELIQKQKEKEKERKKILFRIKLKLFKKWAVKQVFEEKREKAEIAELESEVKKNKDFGEGVEKAKALIDKELEHNSVWMLKKETPEIIHAARMLQDEAGLYQNKKSEKVGNPPLDSDLIILATAMQLSVHGIAFIVTRDSGLANAIIYVNKELGYRRVIAKRNALGPWFKEENNNNKGD